MTGDRFDDIWFPQFEKKKKRIHLPLLSFGACKGLRTLNADIYGAVLILCTL